MESSPLQTKPEQDDDDEKPPLDQEEERSENDSERFVAPDGGWGWVIVAATFLTSLVVDGIIFSFGILLPELLTEFGEGQSITSWVGSALAGTYLLIGPVAGALANKFGCRTISIVGSFISAAAFICSMWADNIIFLIISYGVVGGIGFGFIYLPSMVIIQTYFEKKRAFATGIAVCGSGIGMFIFSPLTRFLINEYGWKGMLLIQAGITLHCVAFSQLFLPVEDAIKPRERKEKSFLLRTKEARDALYRLSVDSTISETPEEKLPVIDEETTDSNKSHRARTVSIIVNQNGYNRRDSLNRSADHFPNPHKQKKWKLKMPFFKSKQKRRRSVIRRATSADFNRPFFRTDLFLSGSLATIPRYVTESAQAMDKIDGKMHMKDSFKQMLDLSLLKSPTFVTICTGGFLTFMVFFVPFMYISDYAVSTGRTKEESAYLISVIGITNTVGRIISGWVSDRPKVKALYIYNGALLIAGIATALIPFCKSYAVQLVYCVIFGLAIASYVSLRSIILVEYLGLETLTNTFGLTLLFQGTASLIGPPVAGWFYKQGNSYDLPFYVAGTILAVSGLICVPLPCIRKWENKRIKKKQMKSIDESNKVKSTDIC